MPLIFPTTRKMHIVRIFGKKRNGDRNGDIWVDLVRFDELGMKLEGEALHSSQQYTNRQDTTMKFKWPDTDGTELDTTVPGFSRLTRILKICSPSEKDFKDPDEWVPVHVIRTIRHDAAGSGTQRKLMDTFSEKNRKTWKNRRFVHYDTSIDDAAKQAFDEGFDVYRTTTDQYEIIEDSKSDDDYIEHQVAEEFENQMTHHWVDTFGDDLKNTVKLKQQYLVDFSVEAKMEETGEFDKNPPWVLDPFQNIINSTFGGLAVEFHEQTYAKPVVPELIGIKKFVISMWFRIPGSTMDAVKAEAAAEISGVRPRLNGVIPLVTWGPVVRTRDLDFTGDLVTVSTDSFQDYHYSDGPGFDCSGAGWVPDGPLLSTSFTKSPDERFTGSEREIADPSYIGVDCGGSPNEPALGIKINMPKDDSTDIDATELISASRNGGGRYFEGVGSCSVPSGSRISPCFGLVLNQVNDGPLPGVEHAVFSSDNSGGQRLRYHAIPEVFRTLSPGRTGDVTIPVSPYFFAPENDVGKVITPNHWHHLLLVGELENTVEVSGTLTNVTRTIFDDCTSTDVPAVNEATVETIGGRTTSSIRLLIALDDENLEGKEVSTYYPNGHSDKNLVLSVMGWTIGTTTDVAFDQTQPSIFGRSGHSEDVGHVVPHYSYTPSGIDFSDIAFPAQKDYQEKVRDVDMAEFQLFTGVSCDPSEEGVRRAFVTDKGKPAPMSEAIKLLGKDPDLVMHKRGNWKKARNTAPAQDPPIEGETSGGEDDIIDYSPDPNLFDDQGDPD